MNYKTLTSVLSILLILSISAVPLGHALDIDGLDDILYSDMEKRISMDFTNAKLNNVLKIFSQQSGLNFVVSTETADKLVDIYLDQVSVEAALEQILAANNLSYTIDPSSNIFIINELQDAPKQFMTRVYPLKFATVPSSRLNNTFEFDNEDATTTASSSEFGIIAAIEAVLSEEGKITEDIRTNSIIVSDIPSQFPLIEQTITRLDVRIPQILIEAELLDISSNTADLMGAKFGTTPFSFTGASRASLYPFDRNKALVNDGKVGGQGHDFNGAEFTEGSLSFAGLSVILQFLRTQTDTKNLARPRILTLNNSTAEIAISTDETIGETDSEISGTGGLSSATTGEAERTETGVFLKVTPQANIQTREITMAIEPKVIQAKVSIDFPSFKDPEERGTKSVLRVNDGDTIVLGGLLKTDLDDVRTSVPVIGSIPVLGAPFRHKDKSESSRELIIFITPHILEEHVALNKRTSIKKKITREQTIPSVKSQAIDKELSYIEQRRFN